jgi:AcrR family transcriptional regulator
MRAALDKAREAPASTKARILAAAEEAFASGGFAGASTREIAAAAHVNISSLHYHWESKETLYVAVFQNIYDRILDLVRRSIPPAVEPGQSERAVVEAAVGGLFDFFADHPTVPKLLVRRLLENDGHHIDIERDVLVPAWRVFAGWTQALSSHRLQDVEWQLFMLTVHNVMLLFLLDSRHFASLLGGSVRQPDVRRRVRTHVINLVHTLLAEEK